MLVSELLGLMPAAGSATSSPAARPQPRSIFGEDVRPSASSHLRTIAWAQGSLPANQDHGAKTCAPIASSSELLEAHWARQKEGD